MLMLIVIEPIKINKWTNLNTSNVNVNLKQVLKVLIKELNLNTSNVNVNL